MAPIRPKDYYKYINSKEWKEKRKYLIALANKTCQRCGATNVRLEVHHKTYERFMHERNTDLIVVCEPCHKILDKVRVRETNRRIDDNRLNGWATKVYGEDWVERVDPEQASDEFQTWLENKEDGWEVND